MFVDRFMSTAMHYPCNYGYIPHTLSDDGDPCDVLVLSPVPLITGVVVRCRPIGMLKMDDEAGGDAKILAVPIDKLSSLYRDVHVAARPAAGHDAADRALLRALQGSRARQVGAHRELDRGRRGEARDHGQRRALQEVGAAPEAQGMTREAGGEAPFHARRGDYEICDRARAHRSRRGPRFPREQLLGAGHSRATSSRARSRARSTSASSISARRSGSLASSPIARRSAISRTCSCCRRIAGRASRRGSWAPRSRIRRWPARVACCSPRATSTRCTRAPASRRSRGRSGSWRSCRPDIYRPAGG